MGVIWMLEECLLAASSPSLSMVSKLKVTNLFSGSIVPLAMFIIIIHVQAVLLGLKMEKSIVEVKGLYILEHKITALNIHSII